MVSVFRVILVRIFHIRTEYNQIRSIWRYFLHSEIMSFMKVYLHSFVCFKTKLKTLQINYLGDFNAFITFY